MAGVEIDHIPYKGSGPALTDVLGNQVPIIFDNLHSMHDVISDILANPSVPRARKRAEILRAARLFREQESGSFVHFTSTSGLIGNFGQTNYGAAKGGIWGLSNVLAIEGRK